MHREPVPNWSLWERFLRRIHGDCRLAPRIFSVRAWPVRWPRTAAVFAFRPCATSLRGGCSRFRQRRCCRARSTSFSGRFAELSLSKHAKAGLSSSGRLEIYSPFISLVYPFGIRRPLPQDGSGAKSPSESLELPMSQMATTAGVPVEGVSLLDRKKHKFPAWITTAVVLVALLGGLGYIGIHVAEDMKNVTLGSTWPYLLLGIALFIALGFEFVNGFHD